MKPENKVLFQPDGSPYSTTFDDIYFDTVDGCRQSEQVFIKSNKIENRLLSNQEKFVIAETGFGTGLNFFLTLALFDKLKTAFNKNPAHHSALTSSFGTLLFISVEKYPLNKAQIETSLAIWPELAPYLNSFLDQYPDNPKTGDVISFTFLDGSVTLSLMIDDATCGFEKLTCRYTGIVDAWYLDGFSPAQNPDIWSDDLFAQVARLSKEQATLATFTIAGKVRRGLIDAGFRVTKSPSVGKKKECLVGVFQQHGKFGKGYQLRPKIIKPMRVAIVGGGIASACAAYALTKQGVDVTVYCQDSKLSQGASSNAIGALYPLLHQQRDDISEFYQTAFWRARALYDELLNDGYHFGHQWCGVLDIAYKKSLQTRQAQFEKINAWPSKLITSVDAKKASELANIELPFGGLFMPNAGWISPPELVNALFSAAKKTNNLKVHQHIRIKEISHQEDKTWQLHTNEGDFKASTLIICSGADTAKINIVDQLPLSPVRGQVTNMKANNDLAHLNTVICHKGYLTPAYKHQQCIGATFDKDTFDIEAKAEDDDHNLAMLAKCLPTLDNWQQSDIRSSKARLRCTTPDHLPIVGVMPNLAEHQKRYGHLAKDKNWRYSEPAPYIENLYLLTGLGARGLCSAPLLADILTADLTGQPYPVDNNMLFNLAPNRFIIRDIIKRKVSV